MQKAEAGSKGSCTAALPGWCGSPVFPEGSFRARLKETDATETGGVPVKLFRKKQSVFAAWLLSYVSMLAIPILLCIFLFSVAQQSIEEQITRANAITMRHMRESLDSRIREMKTILLDVAWDKEVAGFLSAQEPLSTAGKIQEVEIIDYLKQQLNLTDFASSLYIYFGSSDLFLTSTGAYPPADMYQLNLNLSEEEYEDWYDGLQSRGSEYEMLSYRMGNQTYWDGLTIHMYLPFGSRGSATGRISIAANADQLVQILREMGNSGSQSFILDGGSDVLVSSGEDAFPEELLETGFSDQNGTAYLNTEDGDYVVAYIGSEVCDWTYVSITPREIFFSHLTGIQLATWIGMLLCVLLGVANAYIFSRRNYRKVRALTDRIVEEGELAGAQGNEFEQLGQYIELSQNYKKEIRQRLDSHREILRKNYLHDLLFGIAQENSAVQESLEGCGVSFTSPYFAAAVVDGEGVQSARGRLVLESLFEELSGEQLAIWSCRIGSGLALILNPASADGGSLIKAALERGCSAALDQFSLPVFAAVSAIHETIYSLPVAYGEAREALSYRIIRSDPVLLYHEFHEEAGGSLRSVFSPELQRKLSNCVRAADVEQSRGLIRDITESLAKDESISADLARCVMFAVINTVLNALDGMKALPAGKEPSRRLLACRTMEEMSAVLSETLDAVEQCAAQQAQQKENGLEDGVKAFVAEHYADYSLNISVISEAMQMNPAYLSRCFREKSGVSLLDYLNLFRISKAEELMRKTKSSLQEIAEQVGYNNSNALIRAYKKYRGITPGKYRELLSQEEEQRS